MKTENETQLALKNRVYGLLFLATVGVIFCIWPPARDLEARRGVLGVLQDMGMGETAVKIRMALYWGAVIVLALIGGYQVVTGRRVKRPDR